MSNTKLVYGWPEDKPLEPGVRILAVPADKKGKIKLGTPVDEADRQPDKADA